MNANALQRGLSGIWWQVLLRCALSLMLGLVMLVMPGASVKAYEEIFGAYALADGFLLIIQVLPVRHLDKKARSRLLHGIMGTGVGAAVFLWPGFREIGLANIFSAYVAVTGALQVFTAIELRPAVRSDYLLAAGGFLSLGAGLLIKVAPMANTVRLAQIIGVFLIAYATVIFLFMRGLRGYNTSPEA
jgi:uncharacterized membrane protein HdeD (DUF308 family)